MMRSRKLMLRVIHPLIETGLILHRWTDTLIAVAVVLLPFGNESFLGIGEVRVRRSETFLCRNRTASGRRGDHISVLADAHRHVAHVHGDLTRLGISQRLRQRPDVVVGEPKGLDFRQLRVLRKRRQCHPQTFQRVVQCVHPVTFAIVRLYPTGPFQPEHLRMNQCGGNRLSDWISCFGDSKLTSKPESEELESSSKPPSPQKEYSEDMLNIS